MISHLKIIDQFFTWDSNNFDNFNANSLKNCDEAVEAIRNFNWNCTLQFFLHQICQKKFKRKIPHLKIIDQFFIGDSNNFDNFNANSVKNCDQVVEAIRNFNWNCTLQFFCIKSVKNCSQIAKSALKTVDEFEKMKFNRRLHRCSQKLQSNCCNDKTSGFQSSGWWLSFAIWALDSV